MPGSSALLLTKAFLYGKVPWATFYCSTLLLR